MDIFSNQNGKPFLDDLKPVKFDIVLNNDFLFSFLGMGSVKGVRKERKGVLKGRKSGK